MTRISTVAALVLSACMIGACAHVDASTGSAVVIERAIVRASEGQGGVDVAAYAAFRNPGADDAIIAAECSCAQAVELHVVRRDNGTPSMTTDWPLDLPAAGQAEVAPGSPRHFMLIGVTTPIVAGEVYRLRFQLRSGREVVADFVGVSNSAEGWRVAGATI